MGLHADDFLEDVLENESLHAKHAAGQLTNEEAYSFGLIDELGRVPNEALHHYTQVDDIESLETKLTIASLQLENQLLRKELQSRLTYKNEPLVWVSANGIHYLPSTMSTSHLRNAVAYAERKDAKGFKKIINKMKKELRKRKV